MPPDTPTRPVDLARLAWQKLVRRCADGRPLCNCRDAYATAAGGCPGGCNANLIAATYEIGARVIHALDGSLPTPPGGGAG